MEGNVSCLFCSLDEIKFLKRSKHFLEGRYNLQIFMPDVDHNATTCCNEVIAVSVVGDGDIVKNHLQKQMESHKRKLKRSSVVANNIITITLSDSDSEDSLTEESAAKGAKRPCSESIVDLAETIKTENASDSKKLCPTLPDFIPIPNKNGRQGAIELDDSVVLVENVNTQNNIENKKYVNLTEDCAEGDVSVICLDLEPTTAVLGENNSALIKKRSLPRGIKEARGISHVPNKAPSFYPPLLCSPVAKDPKYLRPIIIDGSNVARTHGKPSNTFSCEAIKICVEYFLNRGHTQVTAFVPQYRRHSRFHPIPNTGTPILEELATNQHVVFTPSRRVNGKNIASYDDRFIVELASRTGGVILSNDNYRDLIDESPEFKKTIEERLLMYCFAGNNFMVPNDPLGRHGPNLEEFLSFPITSTEKNS